MRLRPEVRTFAGLMERRLGEWVHRREYEYDSTRSNSWKSMRVEWLLEQLKMEVEELIEASCGVDSQLVADEAADVANYAMFVADVWEGLAVEAAAQPGEGE